MKKDRYYKKRGGFAKIINVSCANCGKLLFIYQKDGAGWLKRCYLNRIISPSKYEKLQHNKEISEPNDLKNLKCDCGSIIGSPMKHKDGRLAFHLIRRNFKRTINKSKNSV